MPKLIVVTRERLEAAHRKLEKLLAKDPHWQQEKRRMKLCMDQEKARCDAEWAAKQATVESSKKETA